MEIVKFFETQSVIRRIEQALSVLRNDISEFLPSATVTHIGSTSNPARSTLTKGDLDVLVRIPAHEFGIAERRLAQEFSINTGSDHTESFAAFEAGDRYNVPCGVQLVAIDGPEDKWFLSWVSIIDSDVVVAEEYDKLKRRFEGRPMSAYRLAKREFIESVLSPTSAVHKTFQ